MSFGRGLQKKQLKEKEEKQAQMDEIRNIPNIISNSITRKDPFSHLPPVVNKNRKKTGSPRPFENLSIGDVMQEYNENYQKGDNSTSKSSMKFRQIGENVVGFTVQNISKDEPEDVSFDDLEDSLDGVEPYVPLLRNRGRGNPNSRHSLAQYVLPEVNRQISIGRGVRSRGRGIPLRTLPNRFENVSVSYQGTRLRFTNPSVPASTRFNTPPTPRTSSNTSRTSSNTPCTSFNTPRTSYNTSPPPLHSFNTPSTPRTSYNTPPPPLYSSKTPPPLRSSFNTPPLTSFSRFNP